MSHCRARVRSVSALARGGRGVGAGAAHRAAVLVETWLTNERKRVPPLDHPLVMMVAGGPVLAILLPIFESQSAVG